MKAPFCTLVILALSAVLAGNVSAQHGSSGSDGSSGAASSGSAGTSGSSGGGQSAGTSGTSGSCSGSSGSGSSGTHCPEASSGSDGSSGSASSGSAGTSGSSGNGSPGTSGTSGSCSGSSGSGSSASGNPRTSASSGGDGSSGDDSSGSAGTSGSSGGGHSAGTSGSSGSCSGSSCENGGTSRSDCNEDHELLRLCVQNLEGQNRVFWIPTPGLSSYWRGTDGAYFIENDDGSAVMKGAIYNIDDPCYRFSYEIYLQDRVTANQTPPAGSPKTNNFIDNNGVATDDWYYYETFTGTLSGRLCLEGAELSISRRGEAFQIGNGANMKELCFGGSGWFDIEVLSWPDGLPIGQVRDHGDINMCLGEECICFGGVEAAWENYGEGTPGCGGVPALTLLQKPLTNTSVQFFLGNESNDSMICAVMWSEAPDLIDFPQFGVSLLLALPPIATVNFSVPPGGLTFDCQIDDNACMIGEELFLQTACVDPCASHGISASRGLRILIGDL